MAASNHLLLVLAVILACVVRPRSTYLFGLTAVGQDERTLLLTAHPDDETFFFSPTLTALSHIKKVGGIQDVLVVCLSTGNAKGLGNIRKEEFGQALEVFGIREGRRFILDHPNLQDNKTAAWDPAVIAQELRSLVFQYSITTIFTFDGHGITGHPNHSSALAGAAKLVSTFPVSSANRRPRLFALDSRPATKHLGPLAALLPRRQRSSQGPVFVASLTDYITALRAMVKHPSQLRLVAFLKGLCSRYLWVNEWAEVTV
ncbi:LmbE-like protein [Mycena sanguinolenta]|uniref:N-acetylglucosaminylphosphatidylinositol deacetylase n=1 Tax=Mycena sanguinolenta TaxID=230812 RepID=A0A8H6XHV7_9AGAR|nr:LmbE-like protein [Mycena sanguinolenta]